jgi:predicted MPP superfamily phosphohydrolase
MFELETKKLKLNKKFEGLKVLQLSDLHISKFNFELIENVIEKINTLYADIVVITGDFICHNELHIDELKKFLKKINAKVAKYACLGNHDYADNDCSQKIQKILKNSDFHLLKNSRDEFFFNYHKIGFSGLDDYENGNICYENSIKTEDIVLSHNPITFSEAVKYSPSLMLSGHTHGVQIKNDLLKVLMNKFSGQNYIEGLYQKENSYLYVNRGVGNVVWHPKILNKEFLIHTPRINSKAEVTMFEFE